MKTALLGSLALAGALAFDVSLAQITQLYTYEIETVTAVDLGTLGGDESEATDINNLGEIVGWAKTGSGVTHAFIHRNGIMDDIGWQLGSVATYAWGINNNSEVVGHFQTSNGAQPFYWVPGGMVTALESTMPPIPTAPSWPDIVPTEPWQDDYAIWAQAINDYGRIVGRSSPGNLPPLDPCYLWLPLQWTSPSAPPHALYCPDEWYPGTRALDVSNSGRIVGWEQDSYFKAFAWKDGVKTDVPMPQGSTDFCDMWALGVNDAGVVVGATERCHIYSSARRAMYWDGVSAMSQDIGVPFGGEESEAREVNDQNFVAGYSEATVQTFTGGVLRDRAFLWHAHFGMRILPKLPNVSAAFTNCAANSLNNRNGSGLVRVVGYCTVSGKKRAVRWDVAVKKRYLVPQP